MEPQLSYSLIDQKTGQVKVLVGGRGQKQDDLALNRATSVKRQPGSTFKILSTYAPGIDTGSMTLATVFDDAPYRYENGQKVTNYVSTSYKGLTTLPVSYTHLDVYKRQACSTPPIYISTGRYLSAFSLFTNSSLFLLSI